MPKGKLVIPLWFRFDTALLIIFTTPKTRVRTGSIAISYAQFLVPPTLSAFRPAVSWYPWPIAFRFRSTKVLNQNVERSWQGQGTVTVVQIHTIGKKIPKKFLGAVLWKRSIKFTPGTLILCFISPLGSLSFIFKALQKYCSNWRRRRLMAKSLVGHVDLPIRWGQHRVFTSLHL